MKKLVKIFLFFIILSPFLMPNVYASSLKVNEITVKDKSGTITIEDLELDDDGTITSNITFNQIHDFVTFDVEIENGENTPYALESITNNKNEYLSVEYEYGKIIQPGTKEHFNVTIKYSEELINHDDITYNNLSLRLNFSNDQALINPQTSNPIQFFIKVLFLLGLLFVGTKYLKKKHIKLFILFLLLIPFLTKAEEGKTISLNFNNVKVKARLLEYEIVIDLGNGEYQTVNETYGTTIEELPEPEKRGYSFTKWVNQDNEEVSSDTIITGDMELTPVYEPIQYTITYNLAGGTVTNTNPVSYNIETNTFTLNNPTKPGYIFSGWRDEDTQEIQTRVVIQQGTINNKTYTATFSTNTNTPYTVIHKQQNLNNNDYTTYETENLTGATDSSVTPQRRTYTGFTAPSGQTVTINGNGTTTVTYLYTRNTYTFSVSDRTYVTGTSNGTYKYGYSISVTAQSRAGYTFKWSDNTTSYTKSFTISSNTTLSAVYTARTDTAYTVIHQQQNIDDNNYTTVSTLNYTGTTGASITPAVNSYTGFTAPSTQTKTINGDGSTTFTYQYNRISYTLTLNDSNYITTTTPSGSYRYGKSITLTANTREGYTFTKWSDNTTGTTYTFTLTGNKTIGPVYEQNKVTITFNANGGTVSPASREIVQGAQIGELPTPERTDYQFLGWYTALENGTEVTATTTFNTTTSIYALWRGSDLLYNVLKYEYEEDGLAHKYTGAHQDSMDETKCTKDIYHWYAENNTEGTTVNNKNNVIFGNQCWKMVRTTDTGGVKMMYNGEAMGGKCLSTRGTHVGYLAKTTAYLNYNYWYGTDYIYDSMTNTFKISGTTEQTKWNETTWPGLIGKYTCKSTEEDSSCSKIYLVESYLNNPQAYLRPLDTNSHYSQFGVLEFNSYSTSPADAGYMYNTRYSYKNKYMSSTETILTTTTLKYSIWYADSVTWGSPILNKYNLDNPNQLSVTQSYIELSGKYTFNSTEQDYTSPTVQYIASVNGSVGYTIPLGNESGTTYDLSFYNYTYTYGDSYVDNGDGTYTVTNQDNSVPETIKRSNWYSYYGFIGAGKYVCKNAVNNTCSDLWYTTATSDKNMTYLNVTNNYKYSKEFTWDGSKYILDNDTSTSFWNIGNITNRTSLNNAHYTCWNKEGECTTLSYIYKLIDNTPYYIDLMGGKNVEAAINEMLYDNEVNTINSTIKIGIDAWYKHYLLNDYDDYIEDTIFCNDRSLQTLGGWNPNGGQVSGTLYFNSYNTNSLSDLSCTNTTDKFSISNSSAQLTYKVGLMTIAELYNLHNQETRKTGKEYWTATPSYFNYMDSYNRNVNEQGSFQYNGRTWNAKGVRPAISLIPGIKYSSGDGSMETPYVIKYEIPEETTPVNNKICKRATTLHTATCSRTSDGCYAAGYYSGGSKDTTTITYGSLGTSGTLIPGDAFDCDVNNDGIYDALTERFYYVTSSGNNAVLIYYANVTGGVATTGTEAYSYATQTSATDLGYTCTQSSGCNNYGPLVGYAQLPSTTQWSNSQLIAPGTRQITTETGTTSTSNGTIESFTYTNKAARLLTAQEVNSACGITVGRFIIGNLDNCNYLLENTQYEASKGKKNYWLETPHASYSYRVWYAYGYERDVNYDNASVTFGVRPVITVLTSNISY